MRNREEGGPAAENVVGLIPAAGRARRLGALPFSKELLPYRIDATLDGPRPRLAVEELLASFTTAGVERAFVVIDRRKTDLPRHLGAGPPGSPRLAYLTVDGSRSVPETLAAAAPFVRDAVVALGFPDVLFRPADAYRVLLEERRAAGADVMLGCFPAPYPHLTDMVDLAEDGRVRGIEIRLASTRLTHNWLLAVWGPAFTDLLVRAAAGDLAGGPPEEGELQLGALFQEATRRNFRLRGMKLPDALFVDVGTPTGYEAARSWTHRESNS